MCNGCHILQWNDSIFLVENILQCKFYFEIQRDHIVVKWYNYLFVKDCKVVALGNVEKNFYLPAWTMGCWLWSIHFDVIFVEDIIRL